MTWNMSAPLPESRLGIRISTVEPRSLLGPLFMAWKHSEKKDELRHEERAQTGRVRPHLTVPGRSD